MEARLMTPPSSHPHNQGGCIQALIGHGPVVRGLIPAARSFYCGSLVASLLGDCAESIARRLSAYTQLRAILSTWPVNTAL
jgi:hypothetical protein